MSIRMDWNGLDAGKHGDEAQMLSRLCTMSALDAEASEQIRKQAIELVVLARKQRRAKGMMESFLQEFGLSNKEGLALMCLAEALLRVPDGQTADALIAEKIASGDWSTHAGQSESLAVNASTWGLMLTGTLIDAGRQIEQNPAGFVKRLASRIGEPAIRSAMLQAMRIMGEQFVLGRDIKDALKRGKKSAKGALKPIFSFDMLGEGACTAGDATRYHQRYAAAIHDVGKARGQGNVREVSGVSVKLSALHPRYEAAQWQRVHDELYPKVLELAELAKSYDIGFCLDAEEVDRLILSLGLLERLALEPSLAGWDGLGLAVQAYQKRALGVISRLQKLAVQANRQFMVRLVKGAYWDTEIKHAHETGTVDFPVWTTKQATDLNFLACARALLVEPDAIYAQFATHNAHSLAAVQAMAEQAGVEIEFQRLHGMGEALYTAADQAFGPTRCRIYAPVGSHEDLLPYLVRRLLENGANTSFVHSFLDEAVPATQVAVDPFCGAQKLVPHPRIPVPPKLFGSTRQNSAGMDLSVKRVRQTLTRAIRELDSELPLPAGPVIIGKSIEGTRQERSSPADPAIAVAQVTDSTSADVETAFSAARAAAKRWNHRGGAGRASLLRSCGDALEANGPRLIALMAREAGKILADGLSELREAVDFCRYYAQSAEENFGPPKRLPGPAGETNHLALHGRGVFVCISPWNFPLAIFTGQIMAALAAGNPVLAKPAEQTPLIAAEAVKLFHQAGIPDDVLHLLPGPGSTIGAQLVAHESHDGVVFTGGTDTARLINCALAERDGPIVPLIAETGGLNTMVVDTSALREQVIVDVIGSAFGAAGQRCSALRVLLLPIETADALIEGLHGAMDQLHIGDPAQFETDIGPVIDLVARQQLMDHLKKPELAEAKTKQLSVDRELGCFFGPALVEISSLGPIQREVFGPVLHVLRYKAQELPDLLQELALRKYGLTLGVHSRISSFAERVREALPVGNFYVNRSMIGAVVGVQPFGGLGLSGTGPKAGGPHYLFRFATEQVVSINIAAQGGDPELLNLD
ncbi:MAG: bifunctional proline dehydrogenase/L-glutamate gamma-semialdehyde dehydrogenase [Robiginitomaculum sp.]|nr:MAG: bifunctional proline dehydrogenase/L-glutamate gamma-semialdehyde dehydrogenase [Robiginitomaculum sp.]